MNALCIDCAVSKIAVAAKKDEKSVKLVLDIGTRQSEKLLPAVDYVMKEAGLTVKDLDYTAVTSGPGTFTGLRLGLSALKAVTLSDDVPLYAVPSLDAYAWPYRNLHSLVLSLIEAKEDEYFYAFYSNGKKLRPEDDKTISEILSEIDNENDIIACGPGALNFFERAKDFSPLHKITLCEPQNDACQSLFENAENMIKENINPLQDYDGPLYVRKSEAELVLESKQK